jgi:hypothetical protein
LKSRLTAFNFIVPEKKRFCQNPKGTWWTSYRLGYS